MSFFWPTIPRPVVPRGPRQGVTEGRPCRRGHTLRYRSNGKCVACMREFARAYYERRR
jgi:hypothetical protein